MPETTTIANTDVKSKVQRKNVFCNLGIVRFIYVVCQTFKRTS